MSREEYFKRLYNYLRLIGSESVNTLTKYRDTLTVILNHFPEPGKATLLQIQDFALTFKNDNTRKNICVLLRWLFNKVLNRNIQWFELPYPRPKRKIQPIYSHEEAIKILQATKSPKQKAILALIIDQGLRCSEPCSILFTDCRMDERKMILRSTKGDKDHVIFPSQYVWDLIDAYLSVWKPTPNKFVFEGQQPGNPYTTSSIRQFIERSCKICGVEYKAVHSFRRYMITWSIENEVDITAVAHKVAHSSIRTIQKHYLNHSEKYLKGINSPLQTITL